MDEVKIPKGLRELYADCLADDSRAMRTTTSKFMAELIERIVRAETQVAEADFNFGGWRAIKKRLEKQVAALQLRLEKVKKPTLYTGAFYATVQLPEKCPDCDARYWISCGPKSMICGVCAAMQAADDAEEQVATLTEQVRVLSQELESNGFKLSADGKLWVPPVNGAATDYWRLRIAVESFLELWPEVEKHVNSAIVMETLHGRPYRGPSLQAELDAMRTAVAARSAAPGKEREDGK